MPHQMGEIRVNTDHMIPLRSAVVYKPLPKKTNYLHHKRKNHGGYGSILCVPACRCSLWNERLAGQAAGTFSSVCSDCYLIAQLGSQRWLTLFNDLSGRIMSPAADHPWETVALTASGGHRCTVFTTLAAWADSRRPFSPCCGGNGRCSLVIHLWEISDLLHIWTRPLHFPEGFERAARIRVIWNKRAPAELAEVTALSTPSQMGMEPFGDLGTGAFQKQLEGKKHQGQKM